MTSLINPNNIDITYPIAGQDNDTQGFRTNYQNIQNNFSVAASEISALQSNLATLQTGVYGNANAAAFLTTYTGNISAGNLSVTNLSYVNKEIIATTEVVGASINVANVIVTSITSPVGSNGNIIIDPDGSADVVFPIQTEIWVYSTATNAITVAGGMLLGGAITANALTVSSAIQFANLTTSQIATISPSRGMTVYNYNTGNIQVFNGSKWANIVLS